MAEEKAASRVDFTVSLTGANLSAAQQAEVEKAIREAAGAAIARLDLRKDYAVVRPGKFPFPWPGGWWVFRDFNLEELKISGEKPKVGP